MPKARTCYVCGRPTLLPGYDSHVRGCAELFEMRESQKPPKERRPCPRDPYVNGNGTKGSLQKMNDAAYDTWKESLAQCRNCGRSFLPEKLAIHNRSCTSSNPARSIQEPVGKGQMKRFSDDNCFGDEIASASTTTGGRGFATTTAAKSTRNIDDGYRETPDYGHLIKCNECGRNFNPESYDKHARICSKVFKQKRKVFDSAKARAKGTELAAYYQGQQRRSTTANPRKYSTNPCTTFSSSASASTSHLMPRRTVGSAGGSRNANAGSLPKWKAESLQFREAMKQARMISAAESQAKATGKPLHMLLPPMSQRQTAVESVTMNPGYIQCPHCGRSFNQKAGERHIPQCQSIINKPSRLSRGSGAPSYSTLSGQSSSSGSRGFGTGTRESAYNNTAMRGLDAPSRGAFASYDQLVGGGRGSGGGGSSAAMAAGSARCAPNEGVRFSSGSGVGDGGRSRR
jgi:Zn finger protein HypA/HybF involved in hydrogenase expression